MKTLEIVLTALALHKYLVGRDGKTVASFKSAVEPESPQFIAKVEELLK